MKRWLNYRGFKVGDRIRSINPEDVESGWNSFGTIMKIIREDEIDGSDEDEIDGSGPILPNPQAEIVAWVQWDTGSEHEMAFDDLDALPLVERLAELGRDEIQRGRSSDAPVAHEIPRNGRRDVAQPERTRRRAVGRERREQDHGDSRAGARRKPRPRSDRRRDRGAR